MSNLFNQRNCLLEVHTEVNELPLNTFLFVLLLLQYKHVMVEELLETFVCVVDTQLLECIVL